jgi:hypothetical protein
MLSQSSALFIRSVRGATLRAEVVIRIVGKKKEHLTFIDWVSAWAHSHGQDCAKVASERRARSMHCTMRSACRRHCRQKVDSPLTTVGL